MNDNVENAAAILAAEYQSRREPSTPTESVRVYREFLDLLKGQKSEAA